MRFATSKKGKLSVALTDKGTMVVEKRLAAEDRAADEVLEGLTCLLYTSSHQMSFTYVIRQRSNLAPHQRVGDKLIFIERHAITRTP